MATSEPDTTAKEQPPSYETSQQQVAYPPGQHHVTTSTTIVAQPTVVPIMARIMFGDRPMNMTCPHCQAQIITATSYEPGILTWLVCGGVAVVGCWCGCCLIPFCVNDLQDCRHSCPNCTNFLGAYRRI